MADDGRHGVGRVCLQGPGPRVVGESDLPVAQIADHVLGVDLAVHVDAVAGAAPSALSSRSGAGEEQRERADRCGRMRSSRMYRFFGRAGSGALALECPWRHR